MKTTKQIFDEEYEYLRERGMIDVERYEIETSLMREMFEKEQVAKVVLGKVRKQKKGEKNATVSRKFPRIISLQPNNRRFLATPYIWD